MADLAKYRNRLEIPAHGQVEIRIHPNDYGVNAWFQCLPCGWPLRWESARGLYECQECGYEMTASEGGLLCQWSKVQIDHLAGVAVSKKGFLWRLFRWFRGNRLQLTE